MKNKDKLFTPGNIILGIIIIILVGSLFIDFFGGSNNQEEVLGCPRPIDNIIITNIIYSADGEPISELREIKEEDDPNVEYKISALIRNIGEKDIIISKLGLTTENFGSLDLVDVDEVVIPGKSMKSVSFILPKGSYHKIDFYTNDVCQGNVIWHEFGEGSKYAWELEEPAEADSETTNETDAMGETA